MSPLINSLVANIFISLLSLIGAIALIRKQVKLHNATPILVSFAAGVMLGAAFFDMLPEAIQHSSATTMLLWTLIGIAISFLMERFVLWYHHHHEGRHKIKPSAFLVLFGDSIHNALDGVAITAAFLASPAIGISATIAIAAHEIPQELADFSILVHSGIKKKRALLLNLLTALTAVVSAVASYFFLSYFEGLLPFALSFTAGMFIYIALADLVPDLHHDSGKSLSLAQGLPFVIGIILMFAIVQFIPHSDENKNEIDQEDYMVEKAEEYHFN